MAMISNYNTKAYEAGKASGKKYAYATVTNASTDSVGTVKMNYYDTVHPEKWGNDYANIGSWATASGFEEACNKIKAENKKLKAQIAKWKERWKMLEMHRTKNGEDILICRMEDEHLENTIKLFLRQLEEAKGLLSESFKISPMKAALYGLKDEKVKEKSEKAIRRVAKKLYPYLAEAMIRGKDYSKELQAIFERTGREDLEICIDRDITCLPAPEDIDDPF